MNRKRIISILALVMAVVMILSLVISVLPAAFAVEEDEIDQLQKEKEEMTSRAEEAQERVNDLQEQQASVLEQQAALNEEKKAAEQAIDLVEQQLALYDEKIAIKSKEVTAARQIEEEQLQRYRMRVRAMEEGGGFSILALVVQSNSLSEFLASIDDIGDIMASDKALERQYHEAREACEKVMAEYEQFRLSILEKQAELNEEKEQIEEKIDQAEEMSASIEEELADALEDYKAARDAEAAAAWAVLDIIAQYDEQKRLEAEANRKEQEEQTAQQEQPETPEEGTPSEPAEEQGQEQEQAEPSEPAVTDPETTDPSETGESNVPEESGTENADEPNPSAGEPKPESTPAPTPVSTPDLPEGATGSFIWPVPCSKRITSRFGNRIDPFTGETRYHSGIDIDGYNNEGNSIVAADGGTVVTSSYNNGYGNYVIIDHGNGYKTLYAHMSGSAVSTGSTVTQGQTIGYLGATGRATGTHCHFEVFLNGSRVDPEQFFSGMTYWNC